MSLELPEPLALPDGHCPVCGGTLAEGRAVACARCETAHHMDCIEYGGGCAVYACGSHAYRRLGPRDGRSVAAGGALLEFVARPAPPPAALAKPAEVADVVQTLAQPVLRVESRRDRRTAALAAAAAAGGLAGAVWLLAQLLPDAGPGWQLWLLLWRELLKSGWFVLATLAGFALAALYLVITVGGHAALYGLGMALHRADTGEYVLDREHRRLVRRPRLLGLPGVSRSWAGGAVRAVRLIADVGTDRVRLEVVLDEGPLVLADDSDHYLIGYHWSELARLGQRLAAELDVPLEWLLPWKPHPGSKQVAPQQPLLAEKTL